MLRGKRSMARAIGIDAERGIVAAARAVRGDLRAETILRSKARDPEELAKEARVSLRSAVLGVGGSQTFLRVLDLPGDLDRRAVAEAVKWQIAEAVGDRLTRHAIAGKLNGQWCVLVGSLPLEAARRKAAALDLRAAALWRGAVHFLGKPEVPIAVVEVSSSGGRVAAGKEFLSFARELGGEQEVELQRTLLYCRSRLGEDLRVFHVGEDLPEEIVAVGLALHRHLEPRFNFLVRERPSLAGLAVSKRAIRGLTAACVLAFLPHLAAFGYKTQAAEYARKTDLLASQAQKCAALRTERQKYEDWTAIVQAFSTSPAWPLMEDLRQATPVFCWLTSAVTEAEQPQQAAQPPQGRKAQQPAQGKQAQKKQVPLPERTAKLLLEGYSKDAASVGLFEDNLEALPWCGGVSDAAAEWDDETDAYHFELAAAVKRPQEE